MSQSKSELAAKNLKTIENYSEAVHTVRKRYFDKAKSQPINSSEQSQSIDQLLVLDCMIESNQRILDYLNHFKKHQNALATKALEDILSKLTVEEQENIHATVQRLIDDIMREGSIVSEQLKNDYNFRGNIYGALASFFLVSCLLMCPVLASFKDIIELAMVAALGASGSIVFIFATIALVLSLVALVMICDYQTNLYAQPGSFFYQNGDVDMDVGGRMAACLTAFYPSATLADSTLFTKSYNNDFTIRTKETHTEHHSTIETTTTTTLYPPEKTQSIATLRGLFAHELADEVAVEYASLNRLMP